MLKVNAALWVNKGFTSCVAFDHKVHRHDGEQLYILGTTEVELTLARQNKNDIMQNACILPKCNKFESAIRRYTMACQTLHYSIFLYFYRILLHYYCIFWDLYLISGHFYSICFVSILYFMICIQYISLFLLYNFRLYCIFSHLHCIFLDLYLISGHFYSILLPYYCICLDLYLISGHFYYI